MLHNHSPGPHWLAGRHHQSMAAQMEQGSDGLGFIVSTMVKTTLLCFYYWITRFS